MEDKKILKKAKNIFTALKTDSNSTLLSEEKIDNRLLKKLQKSKQEKDSLLLKLIRLTSSKFNDKEKHQQESIISKKEKQTDQLYIVLINCFN